MGEEEFFHDFELFLEEEIQKVEARLKRLGGGLSRTEILDQLEPRLLKRLQNIYGRNLDYVRLKLLFEQLRRKAAN